MARSTTRAPTRGNPSDEVARRFTFAVASVATDRRVELPYGATCTWRLRALQRLVLSHVKLRRVRFGEVIDDLEAGMVQFRRSNQPQVVAHRGWFDGDLSGASPVTVATVLLDP